MGKLSGQTGAQGQTGRQKKGGGAIKGKEIERWIDRQ